MKIIYSKYTFEEVHNTRRKWLSDEPGTSHEKIKIETRKIDTGMIKQLILKNYLKDRKC